MVDGSARPRKTFGRKIKSHDEDITTLYSLTGDGGSGVGGGTRGNIIGGGSVGISEGRFLQIDGGTMEGTIGFVSHALQIFGGNLKLSQNTTGDQIKIRKNIFISPEGGTSDDLDTIEGRVRPGQEIRLVGILGNTITIKHNNTGAESGNEIAIICPGAMDYVLTDTEAVDIFYDDVNLKWRISGDASAGGGSGLTEPLLHTITTVTPVTLPSTTDIDASLTNVFEITLDRDIEFDITNPHATKFEMLHIVITQDASTARTITWPGSVNGTPNIDSTLGSETTISLFNMGDATWRFVSTKGGIIIATGAVPAGSSNRDHLEWNGSAWVAQQNIDFDNDTPSLRFRNFLDTSYITFQSTTGNNLRLERGDLGATGLEISSDSLTTPELFTIRQLNTSGREVIIDTTGLGMLIQVESTQVAEFTDTTGLEMLGTHVINMGKNIINTLGSLQFDTTVGFAPTSATTIGFDTTGKFLKYNVGLTSDAHTWYAAGELLGSITRIASNSGQLTIDNVVSDLLQADDQLFFTNSAADPTVNGEMRRNGTTIKAFVDGGVVDLADIGTGGGGLNNVVEDTTPQLGGDLDAENLNIIDLDQLQITGNTGDTIRGFLSGAVGVFNVNSNENSSEINLVTRNSGGTLITQLTVDDDILNSRNPLVFSTADALTASQHGICQDANGTRINAASGNLITLSINNVGRLTMSNTAWGGQIGDDFRLFCVTSGNKAPINLEPAAGDPTTTEDGDIWYNSTSNKYKGKENGTIVTFTTT